MNRLCFAHSPEAMQALFPEFTARVPWWGGHLQTVGGFVPRRRGFERYAGERITAVMSDGSGDRVLAMLHRSVKRVARPRLVLLVHGVSGSQDSSYMVATAAYFLDLGYPVLRCNLRGAGPSRELCRRQYHAGSTEDLACIVATLSDTTHKEGVVAIGYSLGANVLINYLAGCGTQSPIQAAITVCSPLDLAKTAKRLAQWDNALFQCALLSKLKKDSLRPASELTAQERQAIQEARTLQEFDENFTAPRNGFRGASDYYERTSCLQVLGRVAVPVLMIHALDDPLVPSTDYVNFAWHSNSNLLPLASPSGGHVGFQGSDRGHAWHDLCSALFVQNLHPA